MVIKLNGKDFEFDIFELEVAEKYENGLKIIDNLKTSVNDNESLVEVIRTTCETVFDFVDEIFGEDSHKEIFGERTNLKTCVEVVADIVKAIKVEEKELSKMLNKYDLRI